MVAIAVELATAYVSIVPSAKGIAKSIQGELGDPLEKAGSDAGDKSSKKFGSAFKSGLGTAAKAGAVAFGAAFVGAVALGKSSISAAGDLSESMSKVDVVFGDSAKAVVDWSKDSASAFGQSQQSALEAAGTYGNLFQAFGLQQKPAQEMSQSLVELAADLASFNNTSVDEALQALQSGVSGETEPLKRYGVAINDVRLKEEALALGLISSTKDALTPAAKAQASYALIMKDTALAQGDFGRTSDGLANQQRIMSAEWKNAQAAIGKALLPAMTAVVSFIASKAIPKITEIAQVVLPALKDAFDAAVSWVRSNWPAVKKVIIDVFDAIAGAWTDYVQPALGDLWDALKDVWSFVIDNQPVLIGVISALGVGIAALFLTWAAGAIAAAAATLAAIAAFVLVGAAIAALVAGVIYAYQNWEWFRTAVDAVRAWMVNTLWPALQSVFGWLRDNVPPILAGIRDVAMAVFGWLRDNVPPILQGIAAVFTSAFDAIRTVVTTAIDLIRATWDTFGGYIVDYVTAVWDTISAVIGGAMDVIRGIIKAVTSLISGDWSGAWDGIKQIVSGVLDAISGIIQGAIDGYKAILSGAWTAIKEGATIGWTAVKDGISAVWDAITGLVSDGISKIFELIAGIPGGVASAIGSGFDAIWTAFKAVVNRVINAWNSISFPSFEIGGWDPPGPGPTIPSVTVGGWTVPQIPTLHTGGIFPGSSMSEGLALLQGGEGVFTEDQMRAMGAALNGRSAGVNIEGDVVINDTTDLDGFARVMNLQLAG